MAGVESPSFFSGIWDGQFFICLLGDGLICRDAVGVYDFVCHEAR